MKSHCGTKDSQTSKYVLNAESGNSKHRNLLNQHILSSGRSLRQEVWSLAVHLHKSIVLNKATS